MTRYKSLAPVLIVKAVEPCIEFWRDRLGFTVADTVLEGDKIGFAILVGDDVTIMYQSEASLAKDIPAIAGPKLISPNIFYLSVTSIDDVEKRLQGIEKVVPRRTTFYGAIEIGIREPGGYVVLFAQPPG